MKVSNVTIRRMVHCAVLICAAGVSSFAQSPVRYFYDGLGRLIRVADQNGNVATYSYDAVGNLLSISRSNLPANNGVAVIGFSPQSGPVGQMVTIQGQGFSSTPSANTVQFNGTSASVTAATSSTLTVSVPTGATTGPISVTTGGQTATSDVNFKVIAATLNAIVVTAPNATVSVGQTEQLSATGYYSDGTSKDVTASVNWLSSSQSIATVSNQGLLIAVQTGRAGVIASLAGVSGFANIFVLGSISSISVVSSTSNLGIGQAQQLVATAQFADSTLMDITRLANWSSSTPSVATVSNQIGTQGLVSGVGTGQTTVTASFAGTSGSETMLVGVPYDISGTVYAADGQTPDYSGENVQLYDEATGNFVDSTTSDENGQYSFANELLTSPNATVSVTPSCPPVGTSLTVSANGSAVGGQSMTINVTGPLAVVKGQVLFNDGRSVPDATVVSGIGNTYCSGVVEVGVVKAPGGRSTHAPSAKTAARPMFTPGLEGIVYLYPRMPDAQGNFALVGPLKPGPVTLFAGEVDNCLTGTGSGSITSIPTPATVDVTMPPTGTVSGTVVDANGNPSPGANVSVFNPFCSISTLADGLGNYSQNNVQLGNVVVAASPQANNGIMDFEGASAGLLNTDDQNLRVNVQLSPTSTVSGTVLDTDAATPIPSAQVMIENPAIGGGLADYIYNGYENQQGQLMSDSSGNFSVSNVPVGPIRVLAAGPTDPNSPSGNTAGAFIAGTLAQGSPLVINPVMGNGYNFGPLNGSFILRSQPFDGLSCDGTTGIFNSFSESGPYLNLLNNPASVNVFTSNTFFAPGCSLPSSWVDQLELNGQQIEIAPEAYPGSYLQVGRKVFLAPTGGFTRYLEVLTNPFNAPVTATVNISNGIAESDVFVNGQLTGTIDTVVVDPSTTENTYGVLEDLQNSSASVPAFVFAGNSASAPASPNFTLQSGSAISYQWTVTVPANQTVILMHFLIQAPDVNTATTQAQALVNLTDPNALYGMTAAEMSEVVNFNVQ